MRTTVSIDDGVLERAKELARERGISLSAFVELAVKLFANSSKEDSKPAKFKLHTVKGELVDPSIDLDRTSAILDNEDIEAL